MRIIAVLAVLFSLVAMPTDATAKPKVEKDSSKNCVKSDPAVYRITFNKSGGFAGISQSVTLESNKLDKENKKTLSELLDKSGILGVDSVNESTKGAADMYQYKLVVEHKGKSHSASYDDGTLPATYRPLFDFLKKNGTTGATTK